MFVFGFVVLFIGLQVISAQLPSYDDLPAHCRQPPPFAANVECCKLPPLFEPQDFKDCGIEEPKTRNANPRIPDCSNQYCMLKKHGLSKDSEIDYEAVSAFLDKYTGNNKDFVSVVDLAKKKCLRKNVFDHFATGPPNNCEATKLLACLTTTLILDCPVWDESQSDCKAFKDFLGECKSYIHKLF